MFAQACRLIRRTTRLQSTQAIPQAPRVERFWRAVTLKTAPDGYHITLDDRPVKTPKGEWESQQKLLKPYSLLLTSLAVRALDDFQDKATRQEIINKLIKYLQTDAVCFHQEFPESLVEMQEKLWTPLIHWVSSKFSVTINTTHGLLSNPQPQETKDTLRRHVETFPSLKLAAFERAVMTSKSFIIGLGLVEGHISALEACEAACVELASQTQRWGEVEDSHDVDREDIQRNLASVTIVL